MAYKYSFKNLKDNMSKALAKDMPISFKQAIEICNFVRGDAVQKAKTKLQAAVDKKSPIPFKKFTNGLGHKKGKMFSGRFVVKASGEILKLINTAEANALYKGLNSKGLKIKHISVKKAPEAWHYGRMHRRKMKRCHVEVVVEETKPAKSQVKPVAAAKPEGKQAESKPTVQRLATQKTVEQKPTAQNNVKPIPVLSKSAQAAKKPEQKTELKPTEKSEVKPEQKQPQKPEPKPVAQAVSQTEASQPKPQNINQADNQNNNQVNDKNNQIKKENQKEKDNKE